MSTPETQIVQAAAKVVIRFILLFAAAMEILMGEFNYWLDSLMVMVIVDPSY